MKFILIYFIVLWQSVNGRFYNKQGFSKCAPKLYPGAFRNQVCVCNSTFCDEIEPLGEIKYGEAAVYRSNLDGDRLRRFTIKMGLYDDEEVNATITVDATKKFQTIFGFGGAFTDSAGNNLVSIDEQLQEKLLNSYFGANGLEYNVGRVPMASCDFSTYEYSYDDITNDYELKNFHLTKEDLKLKIPFIKKAIELTENRLKLFASPWSSPGWMKKTGRMKGGGELRNDPRVYQSYANYFIKFFEAYKLEGVQFWGLTAQNEPSTGADITWRWQSLNFTPSTQRDFIKNYLGPSLKGNTLTKDLALMILDDGRSLLPGWADTVLNDTETNQYVDGIAVHWYGNLYSLPILLDITQKRHPEKFIFGTEACAGYAGHHGPIMGDWFRAESYADDIITDLNHFVTGWTDWNLCLDETGGPNWVYNVVDSPIIVNRTSQEFYKQPMYYALGHFSKFIPRGSSRIESRIKGSLAITATAVSIPGGQRSIVILNKGSSPINSRIVDASTGQSIVLNIPERSIHTVVWNKKK